MQNVLPSLLGTLALFASSTLARADEPRCDDGKRAPAAAICGAFEAAPKLVADDATAKKVLAVWRRVAPPVEALTGRETALVVLAPEAEMAPGKPFPPAAYICPGAPPTVYVPPALVAKVYGPGASYDDHFMAFVLGHELGHRVNDFSDDGCQLGAFERPGRGVQEEQLADVRGAFFAAVGGYATRALATKKVVLGFLESEFKLRDKVKDERQQALIGALERFDAYEGLYTTGMALTFAGELVPALRLLAWADELVEGEGVPLPELKLMRALALMLEAAPNAPWLEVMDGTGHDLSALRCKPVFASHTPLAEEESVASGVRGSDERTRAKASLAQAKRLLERAAELGADPLVADSARACVAFYLGDVGEAKTFQARAEKRLGPRGAASVRTALAGNAALIAFADLVQRDPPPAPSDAPAAKAWAAKVASARAAFALDPLLSKAVERLASYPAPAKVPPPVAATLACKAARGARASFTQRAALGAVVGQCAAGTTLDYTVPPGGAILRSGTGMGVTACVAADGARHVHVQLAAALAPAYAESDLALIEHAAVPEAAHALDAWACACDAVEPRGVSDRGDGAYLVACPAFGVELGVVFARAGGEVTRVISVEDRR